MERLIRSMKSPELVAECPSCGAFFSMSDAILFDGTKPFSVQENSNKNKTYLFGQISAHLGIHCLGDPET